MRVLLQAVAGAAVIYALLIVGIAWLLAQPWVKDLPVLGTVGACSAGLGAEVVATLLFPGFVAGFIGLFLDDVAAAGSRGGQNRGEGSVLGTIGDIVGGNR